ncbi:MAG: hypothetical protein M1812_000562 [Candelaria pacifica]|nr:MAG: hypothetical protein M1812_000562 [Candelaria pacifica]
MAALGAHEGYIADIDEIRELEYPLLKDTTYLDHAGTTLYAKSLVEQFAADMTSNIFGNPHSASPSSQLSTSRIDDVRLRVLQFFKADPEDYDVVFVANATAGIKLVVEALRDTEHGQKSSLSGTGFWYGYHRDSHTSLVGVREIASDGHRCFESDGEVEQWLTGHGCEDKALGLFAYPGQSNLNGRRLPRDWPGRLRSSKHASHRNIYSLFDAAALVTTAPLDLSDPAAAPDFTVLSFYKIFGFPDLGALIVRRDSSHVLQRRKYFGGGTVEMVLCLKEQWHAKKEHTLHDHLEDGTLPFHNIIALGAALDVHEKLYISMAHISRHTGFLANQMYEGLSSLRHGNGNPVSYVYKDQSSSYKDVQTQGPVVAFNIRNSKGVWAGKTEFEKLATVQNFQLRTGGVCNPGGIASSLGLAPWEMMENFEAGQRCGDENDIMNGKPTGIIRVSLGAMNSLRDVKTFLDFVREFYLEESPGPVSLGSQDTDDIRTHFKVESLTVYPIKSCAGWKVPLDIAWRIRPEGLAWDREWCLVHLGTGAALSQKRYPKMALVRPSLNLVSGHLRISFQDLAHASTLSSTKEITVPLSANPKYFGDPEYVNGFRVKASKVCEDVITAKAYLSGQIADFFTQVIGVPCTLARFPPGGSGASTRHSKAHLQQHQSVSSFGQVHKSPTPPEHGVEPRPILLSNESPILMISRSSLNRLNEQIKHAGGKAAHADVFRANIVIAEDARFRGAERPYIEDEWRYLQIGKQCFQVLGSCRRCQMVCIDQTTAQKNPEPFVMLSKTRKFDGKVFFGQHMCHLSSQLENPPTVSVGDCVKSVNQDLPVDDPSIFSNSESSSATDSSVSLKESDLRKETMSFGNFSNQDSSPTATV